MRTQNRLTAAQRFAVITFIQENVETLDGIGYTEAAGRASVACGFMVTASSLKTSAEACGLAFRIARRAPAVPADPVKVLAAAMLEIMAELGIGASDELRAIGG